MTNAPFLEVEDLKICAGTRELVTGVDLRAEGGRVLGLVGESGSGKSLSCLSILDLLPRGVRMTGGRISVAGRPLASPPARRAIRGRGIAMILQNPMSCFDPLI